MKIYIQSNKFQNLAANVSKYSFERFGHEVNIMNIEENEFLKSKFDKKLLRNGKKINYKNDLQSFTFLRFLAPQLNNYNDLILVIDPDIFALKDPNEILKNDSDEFDIWCTYQNAIPRSEMMLINAKKIKWDFEKIINDVFNFKIDYSNLMRLSFDNKLKINKISKRFNSHDYIEQDTVLLHTTNRMTQPWKLNLQIDFEKNYSKGYLFKQKFKKFLKMRYDEKSISTKYILHNEKNVINSVQSLFKEAYSNGFITKSMVNNSLDNRYVSEEFCRECQIN